MAVRGTYRIRGARLVHSTTHVDRHDEYFEDGDVVEFKDGGLKKEEDRSCFRLGHGGSTLTPVARGSWEAK